MAGPTASIARLASVVLLAIGLQVGAVGVVAAQNSICRPVDPDTQLDRYANAPGGLDARITAQQCRDLLTPARAANLAYNDPRQREAAAEGSGLTYIADWKDFALNGSKFDNFVTKHRADLAGFEAGVFEDKATNTVYVSFAGSDSPLSSPADWLTNIRRGLGGDPFQYQMADMVGLAAKQTYEAQGKKVVFVGHSLGGGLAARASRTTKLEAVIFNADGVTAAQKANMAPEQHDLIDNVFIADNFLHKPSWSKNGPSWLDRVKLDQISQPGKLTWIPHYETCEVTDNRDISAKAEKILKISQKLASLHPAGRPYAFALRATGPLHRPVLEYAEGKLRDLVLSGTEMYRTHGMNTVENYLKICAGIIPADSEFNNVIDGMGGENSESEFGDSHHPNGEGVLPPKIEYQCVFSC